MSDAESAPGTTIPNNSSARTLLTWDDVSKALDELVVHSTRTLDVLDHSLTLQDWAVALAAKHCRRPPSSGTFIYASSSKTDTM